jgi:CO/xanthine dehydrogenase Mo-binding subunit
MTSFLSRREFVAGSLTISFAAVVLARSDGALAQAPAAKLPGSLANDARLDSWLKIGADGEVTIFTGKAELGQGIKTALAQIAADELDVSMARIAIVGADTARTPEEGVTSRSFSIIESGTALRLAAAEARGLLLAKAAEQLSIPVDRLGVSDGTIEAHQKKITYWDLIGGNEFKHQVTGTAKPKHPKDYKYVGRSVRRVDLPGKVTGKPSYVQDLRLDGMLHARVLRPPLDRADVAIESIDIGRASALPGVRKILRNGNFVAVVAEREEQAISALAALKKDARWRVPALPKPEDLKEYLVKAPARDRVLRGDGDVAAALTKAKHVVEAKYFVPYHSHAAMAPSCAVAQLVGERLTVWTHSQGVFELRRDIAGVIGKPEAQIRLIHMEGPACYGQNGADDAALDAALLALELPDRPVRVQWMREDEFAWEPKGPPMLVSVKAGADADGNVVAWDYEYWTPPHVSRYGKNGSTVAIGGWHLEKPAAPFFVQGAAADVFARVVAGDDTFYKFPNKRVVQHGLTQFAPLRSGELRGVGGFQHSFAIETVLDELAGKCGIDPIAFRLRFVADARMRDVIAAVAAKAEWPGKPSGSTNGRGRGFSHFFYDKPLSRAAAIVEVAVDRASGAVKVERVTAAFDIGRVINPDGARNQMEGGIIQALSRTLKEQVTFDASGVTSLSWDRYPILDFSEVPEIDVILLDRPEEEPAGAGEAQTPIIPGAVANAIFDAVGVRLREMPFTPERVKRALTG